VCGSPAEPKVFNPNIGKLDPKTVSCHFIGYPERSKGFRFYCPDRYTKFVETRHVVFLEDEMMRGIMVSRKIDLEEKRVYVPTPMFQEPIFELPIPVAWTVQDTVVTTPIISSPVATMNGHEELVLQDPIENDATSEGEQQLPQIVDVPNVEAPRRSQRIKRWAIPDDYEVYTPKDFKWRVIPPHLKKPWEVSTHQSGLKPWKMKWNQWMLTKFGI
jgi:hypothetical protein